MKIVPNRKEETLLPIIKKFVNLALLFILIVGLYIRTLSKILDSNMELLIINSILLIQTPVLILKKLCLFGIK